MERSAAPVSFVLRAVLRVVVLVVAGAIVLGCVVVWFCAVWFCAVTVPLVVAGDCVVSD